MWGWIIGAVVLGVCGIAAFQYRAQSGTYRSLSSRVPNSSPSEASVPLGMEAIDMEAVDAVNRRNESLERSTSGKLRNLGTFTDAASNNTGITPMKDDETYAKRFYAAFLKNKPKD